MPDNKSRTEPKCVVNVFADPLLAFSGQRAKDENCAFVAN
jgi:hypothetical protein